jgi:hypothetical protein
MSNIQRPLTEHIEGRLTKAVGCNVSSLAVPTAHDDALWEGMTREQQLAALQDHFASEDCTMPTTSTVAEIVARARADRSPA